jgi:hypothetical protein
MSTTTDWIQTGLLLVNAGLIAWYLRETIKLRHAAEKQVEVGQEELEGHAKPALIARPWEKNSQLMELVNIGSGPALHLEFLSVPRKSTTRELVSGVGFDRIAYLESQQTRVINVRTREPEIPGRNTYFLDSSSRSLRCEYRSLSGRVYFSVFDFDHTGNFVEDTHLGEVPKLP